MMNYDREKVPHHDPGLLRNIGNVNPRSYSVVPPRRWEIDPGDPNKDLFMCIIQDPTADIRRGI